MMTSNNAVVMQQLCVTTFNDALPVLSTKNDGHSRMGVFPDPEGLARETIAF